MGKQTSVPVPEDPPTVVPFAEMFSIGLVLSAGGPLGDPWHSGVLGRLQETTGWDPREADLVIGTSAGSITASLLRAGVSSVDRALHFKGGPISPEADAIYARITTPYDEPEVERESGPLSPRMALKAAWPPWRTDPVRLAAANLPRGKKSGASLAARMNELHDSRWPEDPTWIVAVRTNDGRRIVFGRDDVRGTIGQAIQSSAAVPAVYVPARIGEREYVDGGVHSSTNADLAAPLGFDLVIVSSVMTAAPGHRSRLGDPTRAWFSAKLDNEVAAVRRTGTPVLVIEPDRDTLAALDKNRDGFRADAATAGAASLDRALAGPDADGLHELLSRAVR
jgi:NTE family protein